MIPLFRGLLIIAAAVLLGSLVGCDGGHFCPELAPGRYRLQATAVSLNCPDFEAEVDYTGPGPRDAACVEHGKTADSEWELLVTGPGTAKGRLESPDCIWTTSYTRLR